MTIYLLFNKDLTVKSQSISEVISRTALLAITVCCVVAIGSISVGDEKKPADKKPAIPLPMDPKAVVLSFDPGQAGFIRKGEAPYLKIQRGGNVVVTSLLDGTMKEGKLTEKELDDLVRFVVEEQGFLKVTEKKINDGIKEASAKGPFIAVGGAGTSVISVQLAEKKHEVSFRGASAYSQTYPKVVPLAQYAAVEKRLQELGASLEKKK